MSNNKKQFSLPRKKAAKEEAGKMGGLDLVVTSGGGPVSRTNFRADFENQAKQLLEKVVIGPTPEHYVDPKNETSLGREGFLKGEVQTLKPVTQKPERIDLEAQAKTVYEQAKRPMFRKKGATEGQTLEDFKIITELSKKLGIKNMQELEKVVGRGKSAAEIIPVLKEMLAEAEVAATESKSSKFRKGLERIIKKAPTPRTAPIKDELESEDKQPKEAVACEADSFNRRERRWINRKDTDAVISAMNNGDIAKARGRQILRMLGATEEAKAEKLVVPLSSDMGKPIEKAMATEAASSKIRVLPEAKWEPLVAEDTPAQHNDSISDYVAEEEINTEVAKIDTEIGDDLDVKVSYDSQKPVKGSIVFKKEDISKKGKRAREVLEGMGFSVRQLSAKESMTMLFSAKESVVKDKWWALAAIDDDRTDIVQIALEAPTGASEEEVRAHLEEQFGEGCVFQISEEPISK